jgi:Flp pilus assembly pilin Flp
MRGVVARIVAAVYCEDGQAVTEYAMVLVLIAAIAVGLTVTTNVPQTLVDKIGNAITSI